MGGVHCPLASLPHTDLSAWRNRTWKCVLLPRCVFLCGFERGRDVRRHIKRYIKEELLSSPLRWSLCVFTYSYCVCVWVAYKSLSISVPEWLMPFFVSADRCRCDTFKLSVAHEAGLRRLYHSPIYTEVQSSVNQELQHVDSNTAHYMLSSNSITQPELKQQLNPPFFSLTPLSATQITEAQISQPFTAFCLFTPSWETFPRKPAFSCIFNSSSVV